MKFDRPYKSHKGSETLFSSLFYILQEFETAYATETNEEQKKENLMRVSMRNGWRMAKNAYK